MPLSSSSLSLRRKVELAAVLPIIAALSIYSHPPSAGTPMASTQRLKGNAQQRRPLTARRENWGFGERHCTPWRRRAVRCSGLQQHQKAQVTLLFECVHCMSLFSFTRSFKLVHGHGRSVSYVCLLAPCVVGFRTPRYDSVARLGELSS